MLCPKKQKHDFRSNNVSYYDSYYQSLSQMNVKQRRPQCTSAMFRLLLCLKAKHCIIINCAVNDDQAVFTRTVRVGIFKDINSDIKISLCITACTSFVRCIPQELHRNM